MKVPLTTILVIFFLLQACTKTHSEDVTHQISETQIEQDLTSHKPCTNEWYQYVETVLPSGDGEGHGPDIASDEWKSVIEFHLKIRGQESVPERSSPEWCDYIDAKIKETRN